MVIDACDEQINSSLLLSDSAPLPKIAGVFQSPLSPAHVSVAPCMAAAASPSLQGRVENPFPATGLCRPLARFICELVCSIICTLSYELTFLRCTAGDCRKNSADSVATPRNHRHLFQTDSHFSSYLLLQLHVLIRLIVFWQQISHMVRCFFGKGFDCLLYFVGNLRIISNHPGSSLGGGIRATNVERSSARRLSSNAQGSILRHPPPSLTFLIPK